MPDNAAAGQSLFEAWEKRDSEAMGQHFADDVSFTDAPRQMEVTGKDAVRDWYASWSVAFPDGKAGAKVVSSSEDTVVVEGLLVGTNDGPLGPLPATGKPLSLPWSNILRFGSDGKIVGGAAYYDQLTLLTQLGHLPPAP